MVSKAGELPTDIRWRFIGTLQSNKAKAVAAGALRDAGCLACPAQRSAHHPCHTVPNVVCVETVGSAKLANKLNKACEDAGAWHWRAVSPLPTLARRTSARRCREPRPHHASDGASEHL